MLAWIFSYGFFIRKVDKITLIHIASEWHKLNKGIVFGVFGWSSHRAEKNGFLHPHTSWRVKVRFLCEKKASFKRLSTPPCNHESVNTSGRRKPTWVEMYETLTTVTTVDASECCVATLQRFSERGTTQGSGSVREALGPSHSRPTRRHQYVKCWRRGKWQNRQSKNQQTFRPSPPKPIPLFATSWLQYWWQY